MDFDWVDTERPLLPEGAVTPLQQHPLYGAACAALGARVRWLALSGARPAGAVQVLLRRWPLLGEAALVSRGPVWAPEEPAERRRAGLPALLERLRRDHRVVCVTPELCGGADPMAESGWLTAITPCFLAELDLSRPLAEIRAGQHRKWRCRLSRAERGDLRVWHGPMPADPAHWLLRAEARQSRARGYRNLPTAFLMAWIRAGRGRSARLFTADLGDAPIAGMIFLLHGRGASYHIAWTGPEGRRTDAHRRLLWEAMRWLHGAGVVRLDLDRIDTEDAPDLARFKLGSGARAVELGATRLSAPGTRLFAQRSVRAGGVGSLPRPHCA
ncbi:GNAT family N-acetyltransferase [Tropicimonas sp. IMCC6043]|uniref:GNAT family N-acetyltransferase n=1 Tax=Tropicimonas sp. IMCC6043 TaxID=2510645 RepID=UPI00101B9313|nr:GNAT family N-acetyltransferase [Tropicimonas sp. IMCC6043]